MSLKKPKAAPAQPAPSLTERRYVPAHPTEITQDTASGYFDIEQLNDERQPLFVSLAAVGEATVGKTTLLIRFAKRKFRDERIVTIGFDRTELWIKSNHPHYNRLTQVTLFDTGGQEKYRAFGASILHHIEAVFIVFDATVRTSFDACREWRELIERTNQECLVMLVANKIDLYEQKKPDAPQQYVHDRWLALPSMTVEERETILLRRTPDELMASRALGAGIATAKQRALLMKASVIDLPEAALLLDCNCGATMMSAQSGVGVDAAFVELVDLAVKRQMLVAVEKSAGDKKNQTGGSAARRRQANGETVDLRGGAAKRGMNVTTNTTNKISCC